jgi:DNA-binding HxlR family transcriptional regulator
MAADERVRDVQILLMRMGTLGQRVSEAIEDAVGVEVSGNGPVVVLFALDLEGPKRPGDLQVLTGLSSGGVSKLLDRLERAGLVSRAYGTLAEDRRGAVVQLTAKGRRAARKTAAVADEALEGLQGVIDAMVKLA